MEISKLAMKEQDVTTTNQCEAAGLTLQVRHRVSSCTVGCHSELQLGSATSIYSANPSLLIEPITNDFETWQTILWTESRHCIRKFAKTLLLA